MHLSEGHATQTLDRTAPMTSEYFAGGHEVHTAEPGMGLYVPATHCLHAD